jgi:CRISPR/Cas system endoribonuclease Cas6 (RAMP superfamily)
MLQLSKIKLNLEFTTPAIFPYWMGSSFRGGFGQHLRKAICTDHTQKCTECSTKDTCLFYYTHIKKKAERGHAPPIKPIIIIPPFFGKSMNLPENPHLSVELLFFGDFTKYLPHVILGMNLLGRNGFYSYRYQGLNRFHIQSIECCFSGKQVYDGDIIYIKNLVLTDIEDIEPTYKNTLKIGFKTPYTGSQFPLPYATLLSQVRNRVIRFVNEYGTGEDIPPIQAQGTIKTHTQHYHKLERRSMRSQKKVFHSYTGIVTYAVEEMNAAAAWISELGFLVGCGPDASFGCGFLQKLD